MRSQIPDPKSSTPDPYDQVRAHLETVIRSGQSQPIGEVELFLAHKADLARSMTGNILKLRDDRLQVTF